MSLSFNAEVNGVVTRITLPVFEQDGEFDILPGWMERLINGDDKLYPGDFIQSVKVEGMGQPGYAGWSSETKRKFQEYAEFELGEKAKPDRSAPGFSEDDWKIRNNPPPKQREGESDEEWVDRLKDHQYDQVREAEVEMARQLYRLALAAKDLKESVSEK